MSSVPRVNYPSTINSLIEPTGSLSPTQLTRSIHVVPGFTKSEPPYKLRCYRRSNTRHFFFFFEPHKTTSSLWLLRLTLTPEETLNRISNCGFWKPIRIRWLGIRGQDMKRGLRWSDGEDDDSDAASDSSSLDTDSEDNDDGSKSKKSLKASQVDSAKKQKGIDFEALSRHGYKGGLSVLSVPAPKEPEHEPNWSWATGKEAKPKEMEESFEERQRTRNAIAHGEELVDVQTRREKRNISFQQKEKRKRDLGQASRGKNYVEEEKRVLRDNGIYSGFDS